MSSMETEAPAKRGRPAIATYAVFAQNEQDLRFLGTVDARNNKDAIGLLADKDGDYVAILAKLVKRYRRSSSPQVTAA